MVCWSRPNRPPSWCPHLSYHVPVYPFSTTSPLEVRASPRQASSPNPKGAQLSSVFCPGMQYWAQAIILVSNPLGRGYANHRLAAIFLGTGDRAKVGVWTRAFTKYQRKGVILWGFEFEFQRLVGII